MDELKDLDLTKDQHLMSIIKNGKRLADIEIKDNTITVIGDIGNFTCSNFVELIFELQGYDITIDNFFF